MPKRPLTGFQMYLREMREKMKKENPKLVMAEFMKMVSVEWTRMSQDEKKRYERLVEKDRQRYDEEFLEYKKTLMQEQEKEESS